MLLRLGSAIMLLGIWRAPAVQAQSTTPPAQTPANPATTPTPAAKNDYGNPDSWLCRPGRQDACAVDLTTTVIAANGKMKRETWTANPNAPIDCFYVYPTVSTDPTPNSDMIPGAEEKGVVRAQFARFASQCRPFAPMYRQVTLTALRALLAGTPMAADRALAYNDVLDAWNYYLEHDNQGRGVVLIGHSQGSGVLTQLLRSEIDGKPVQSRIISALLLGTSLPVPKGKDVGGALQHMPLCHSASQTGCVITYASFRSTVPPPLTAALAKCRARIWSQHAPIQHPWLGAVALCTPTWEPMAAGLSGTSRLSPVLGLLPRMRSTRHSSVFPGC